jgi:hypothetical protein
VGWDFFLTRQNWLANTNCEITFIVYELQRFLSNTRRPRVFGAGLFHWNTHTHTHICKTGNDLITAASFCVFTPLFQPYKYQVASRSLLNDSRENFTIPLHPADTADVVPSSEESSIKSANVDRSKSITLISNGEKAVLTRKWSVMKKTDYL